MKFIKDITDFIFLEDAPCPADAIVVLGNTWPEPSIRAAALWKEGLAPVIIPTGRYSKVTGYFPGADSMREKFPGPYETEADFMRAVLLSEGVDPLAVIPDPEATFTLENAENVRKILDSRGTACHRLILCCQAFHARRSKMYFEYVFRDREMEFILCPAVTQGINRDNWMTTEDGTQKVLGELMRCGQQFSWMLHPEEENSKNRSV